ncbi:DUF305 domain-containing protein [Spirilliplanes yamanashiensis]|uniref:DUF305 domain-containing protein n=1 Tax=Spirilliplanes yamanashiensis TaxID=42233 RepID=A0A8J4DLQ7_9ACTN|nr:DUF305 domain-containing protein [Spirilliplanes yamanashiensis]MDP9818422.1 uncharacterized protein (DUF305 family) [Spirilliplanes yamanashiensis]GIJ06642.1 hypothetical protein Sya03_59940 [Spirilliplanes yamanashiensis]
MKRTTVRGAVLGAIATATLLLTAACGGDDMAGMGHGSGATTGAAPSAPASGAASNNADVQFAQMMIVHHQQALEMAAMAETRASDAELKKIATDIKNAQEPEIQKMTGWLTAWGQPTAAAGGHNMPGMTGMPGEMSEEDMAKLEAAKGVEFDREFARMMIAHHNGAIEMARTEESQGGNAEAKALATEIATAQTAEVATLQKILDRL